MSRADEITSELADIQRQLIDLPDDAFAERYELQRRQDELRAEIRGDSSLMYEGRSDESLLEELAALRSEMKAVEAQRIDLVAQAGSGGASTGEMGNLGGVALNQGIDEAHGLSQIKNRIGIIKNVLQERGVEVPAAD